MEPIERVAPRIPSLPAVERAGNRVDPDRGKREQRKREQQKREPESREERAEDDGRPHVDISV